MEAKTTAVVTLTLRELLFIDDSLTLEVRSNFVNELEFGASLLGIGTSSGPASDVDLLLKIGGAILAIEEDKAITSIDVCLTEEELWVIREVAKSSVKVGNEQVGLNLKKKVYRALREIGGKDFTEELPFSSEPIDETWREKLARWRDINANSGEGPSQT